MGPPVLRRTGDGPEPRSAADDRRGAALSSATAETHLPWEPRRPTPFSRRRSCSAGCGEGRCNVNGQPSRERNAPGWTCGGKELLSTWLTDTVVAQEAAQAGHTLSVDMLSLSDGNLPSLSLEAAGDFQTESFRCESGFQMLLEHISDPKDQPRGAGPSAVAQSGGALAAGAAHGPERLRRGAAAPDQPPLQLPLVASPSPAFLRMMAAAQAQRPQQSPAQPVSEPLAAQVSPVGAALTPAWPPASTRVPSSDPTRAQRDNLLNPAPAWPPASTRTLSDHAVGRVSGPAPGAAAPGHRRAGSGGAAVTRHGGDHISKPGRSQLVARSPAAAAQLIAAAQDARATDPSGQQQQPQWPWQSSAEPVRCAIGSQGVYQPSLSGYQTVKVPPAASSGSGMFCSEPGPVEGGVTRAQQLGEPTFIQLAGTGPYLLGQLGSAQAGFQCVAGGLPCTT